MGSFITHSVLPSMAANPAFSVEIIEKRETADVGVGRCLMGHRSQGQWLATETQQPVKRQQRPNTH